MNFPYASSVSMTYKHPVPVRCFHQIKRGHHSRFLTTYGVKKKPPMLFF